VQAANAAGKPYLYTPATAYRSTGVTVEYALPQADAGQPVTLEFLDPSGKLIRKYSSTDTTAATGGRRGGGGFGGARAARVTTGAGYNKYTWNLQYPDASSFNGMILWSGGTSGPQAAPGKYTVRLTAGSSAPISKTFVVKKDPQSKATNADIAEQTRFALEIRDQVSAANDAVKTIRNVKHQLDERAASMSGNTSFASLATRFADTLSNVEDSLYQTRNRSGEDPLNFPIRINDQMAGLLSFVESGERRPPKQTYDVFAVLEPKMQLELNRYHRVMTAGLTRINASLKAAGQPAIVPSTDEPPAPPAGPVPDDDSEHDPR